MGEKKGGKVYMKKILSFVIGIIMCIVFIILFSGNVFASEEIYFDEDGNLIYITYDKKATSSVSYKAIGWILKRYDAPIDYPGQQYVIVRKIEYAVEDPENPAFLYCYFWSDKDEILNAVGAVSAEWRKQLEKYGATVYIDNVMTVCNSKVPLGNVDENGVCTGEVYFTFEGIANARGWARPEFLKSYFDIKLEFPVLEKEPDGGLVVGKSVPSIYTGSSLSSMVVGSNSYGSEEYDVSVAMPAGEKVYFKGECDAYYYNLSCTRYQQIVYVPVCVDTKYIINWVDINGAPQSETRLISRWYKVAKFVNYTAINDFKIYDLSTVNIFSNVLGENVNIYNNNGSDNVSVIKRVYGECSNHIQVGTYSHYTGEIVLTSTDFKKPDIPDVDYTNYAKNAVDSIQVRSDYLAVNGRVILSDEYKSDNAPDVVTADRKKISLYKAEVLTDSRAKNGVYKDWVMTCNYVERTDKAVMAFKNTNINSVNIHTPVICDGKVYGDKNINQADTPSINDVVLGGKIYVKIDSFGNHNNIKGYGIRDYSKYAGKSYVKFEFPVIMEGDRIDAGYWIELSNGVNVFDMPEDVVLGIYKVEYKTVAKNGYDSCLLGEQYNKDIWEYGAYGSSKVNVIGRLYDFKINDVDIYVAGNKDKNGKTFAEFDEKIMPDSFKITEGKTVVLSLTTMGELENNACIEGYIKYYYMPKGSTELIEVDLYKESDTLQLSEPIKISDTIILEKACVMQSDGNICLWEKNYELPRNFVAVKKDTELRDIESNKDKILRDGTIFVAFEFRLDNGDKKSLFYVNSLNYKKGYCNMWRMQGGKTDIGVDGIAFMTEVGASTKYDYEVNGTH